MALPPYAEEGTVFDYRLYNMIVKAIRENAIASVGRGLEMSRGPAGKVLQCTRPHMPGFLARVETEGPEEEEDYDDERYWVREQHIVRSGHTGKLQVKDKTGDYTRWVTATNLAEWGLAIDEKHLITRPDILIDPGESEPGTSDHGTYVAYERPYDGQHLVWVWELRDEHVRLHYVFDSFLPQFWETYIKHITFLNTGGAPEGDWNIIRFCIVKRAEAGAGWPGPGPGGPETSSEWEPPGTTETYTNFWSYSTPWISTETESEPTPSEGAEYPPSYSTGYDGEPPPSGGTTEEWPPSYSSGFGPPPPTTTTSWPPGTTSGGSEVEHACCPEGAPYRWGFVCSGQDNEQGSQCDVADGWVGDMVWNGTGWSCTNEGIGCTISLGCHTEAADSNPENDYNVWELQFSCFQCFCSWISYEDCPFSEPPDCGLTCTSGTTFVGDDDCFATGPPIDCGSVQIWPK